MFDNEILNAKLLHNALENLKEALINYEKIYKNKRYKFKFNNDIKISIKINESYLNHLLGFDHEHVDTWISYISSKPFYSTDWIRDFANSEEFISYYIFARNQNPYFNFEKINYKSIHFKNLDLKNNIPFIFDENVNVRRIINLGVFHNDKIISLKIKNNNDNCFQTPVSLYVYDNKLSYIKDIKNIEFPKNALIKANKAISLDKNYTEETKNMIVDKIKTLSK